MSAAEEIKSRLSIEDVISEYVQLKRAGRNFKGLSPFTVEKTPSFVISPDKQIWHDFSSGKGGDVFSFVMEVEGLDFKQAIELLARRAGVDLDQFQSKGPSRQVKERLYAALDAAAKFYQVQFSRNQVALQYVLKERQFSKETALEFRLGYAPNTGDALMQYLQKQQFSAKEIEQAGLSAKRYRGQQDMFRGRLMIPLMDEQGKVVGFTARLLDDDPQAPKYINTPQTMLYDKSRHVFGLNLAKEAIRTGGFAVLVEGNLDVIASHQAGVIPVVATAGTALTEMQLKRLQRLAADVRLAFDQDRAGQAATERAIPIAHKVGVRLQMVSLKGGKDPDELIRQNKQLWLDAIAKPQDALDWLIERYRDQLDLSSADGKRQFSDVTLAVVRRLSDSVEQDHYLNHIAEVLGVRKEALVAKLAEVPLSQARRRKVVNPAAVDRDQTERLRLQNHFLALMLMRPDVRTHLDLMTPEMFSTDAGQQLYQYLHEHRDTDVGQAEQALSKISDYVKVLALHYETLYQDLDELEADYEAARLQVRLIEQFIKTKKTALTLEMGDADDKKTRDLLETAKSLDALLKLANKRSS
jgi:DNA primase